MKTWYLCPPKFLPCPWYQVLSTSIQNPGWNFCLGVLKVSQAPKFTSQFVNFLPYTWPFPVFPSSVKSLPHPSSSSNPKSRCDPWFHPFFDPYMIKERSLIRFISILVHFKRLDSAHFSPATVVKFAIISSFIYFKSLPILPFQLIFSSTLY